jgi:hypothetical protein
MSEPVSIGALFVGYAVLAGYARQTSAVSREACKVSEAATDVMRGREGSESLFGQKALALSKLESAVAAVFPHDEQEVVDFQTFSNARHLLLALPDDLPAPEFSIDPDGAISMDWIQSRTRRISVSVSSSERLAYAWLDGSDRGRGVIRFRSPIFPLKLLSEIRLILTDGPAGLQPA